MRASVIQFDVRPGEITVNEEQAAEYIAKAAEAGFSSKKPIFVCSNDAYICVEKQKTYCGQRLPSIRRRGPARRLPERGLP